MRGVSGSSPESPIVFILKAVLEVIPPDHFRQPQGLNVREWLVLGIILISLIAAVQNRGTVIFDFLIWRLSLQKGLLVLFFLMLGFLAGRLTGRGKK